MIPWGLSFGSAPLWGVTLRSIDVDAHGRIVNKTIELARSRLAQDVYRAALHRTYGPAELFGEPMDSLIYLEICESIDNRW